jgi:hypothetical protein
MSRAACSFCGTVVSTTADPNRYEGWFVSLEDAEKLEVDLQADRNHAYHVGGLLKKHCQRIVLCDGCRAAAAW